MKVHPVFQAARLEFYLGGCPVVLELGPRNMLGGHAGGSIDAGAIYKDFDCKRGDDKPQTAAIEALTGLMLAHACAGVDVCSVKYLEGVDTVLESMGNHY